MYNKLIRYFNQNRKKILKICVVIVFFFIILQFLNNRVKEEKRAEYENRIMVNKVAENIINKPGSSSLNKIEENKRVNEISQTTTTNIINEETAIKQFISYCNEGKIAEAYSMLSLNCREENFQSEEQFRKNYYESKFKTKKVSDILSWFNSSFGRTYRVRLYENLLESGSTMDLAIEDYITVEKIDNKFVLNINEYIGKEEIQKYSNENGVNITVRERNVYSNYEEYSVIVKNDTKGIICLDPKEDTKSTYLVGKNDKETKYTSYIHELTEENLVLNPGEIKSFNIKFNKVFTGKNTSKGIRFSNAILNYEDYIKLENKNNYDKKVLLYVNF